VPVLKRKTRNAIRFENKINPRMEHTTTFTDRNIKNEKHPQTIAALGISSKLVK